MRYLSLFTGLGGMDLGLHRAGLNCAAMVEIDEYNRKILSQRWPGVPLYKDVTKFCRRISDCDPENEDDEVNCPRCGIEFGECECIGTDQLTDEIGPIDLVCGGDPCQENSNVSRNGVKCPSLGGEFIRIIEQLRPPLVLRENPSVVKKDAPWPWYRFRNELERMGYAVLPFRLRACCLGADFRRDRLFLLAEIPSTERTGLEGNVSQVMARAFQGGQDSDVARPDRWSADARVCGRGVRIPHRMERLKGLGNAIPPVMGEFIGRMILGAS